MSVTPIPNTRLMSSLKLTPSATPFGRGTVVRSPVKTNRQDCTLALRQVIGTTVASANAFDGLPTGNSFAFTAGAAAVLATVDDDFQVSQRFFRARPTATPINSTASAYGPSTPTSAATENRIRINTSARDSSVGISAFGSPTTEWVDSPGGKSWSARERVKAATCVSLSADGKYLAVGETGYKPRVLIFSTAVDAPSDTPLTSIYDHTFGVRCVSFSPDSQYLASLGAANDGFLYIWSINPRNGAATLHSSNKCTSTIHRTVWLGQSLVTIGTRHIKVWRPEDQQVLSPSTKPRMSEMGSTTASSVNKTLQGRNCLLGNLLESVFTSVVALSSDKAAICTSRGDICLLDDSAGLQRFSKISDAGFVVTAMTLDAQGCLHVVGAQNNHKTLAISEFLDVQTSPLTPAQSEASTTPNGDTANETNVEAINALNSCLVTIDSRHVIRIVKPPLLTDSLPVEVRKLPAHGDAVLGVRALTLPNKYTAAFFTWSVDGSVLFWNHEGQCSGDLLVKVNETEDEDEDKNELRVVRSAAEAKFLACGDKVGFLKIVGLAPEDSLFTCKAHDAEVTDVAILEGPATLVASCSRDRTVQVFQQVSNQWELLQTLDEHVGAVTSVLFNKSGTRLISSSSDRTIVVRESVSREENGQILKAFVILRTITLKATPQSIVLDIESDDTLLVSTIDRHVHRYDLESGQLINSFKATDSEGGDAVAMSALVVVPRRGTSLVGGVSSTDKSVRLYTESGTLVKRDWGHTEGVTDITLVTSAAENGDAAVQKSLVTVAADGTIFIWDLDKRQNSSQDLTTKSMELMGANTLQVPQSMNRPPLRRVLSQSELARFQRPSSQDDTPTPTPGTGNRSPRIRKKSSRFSLAQAPRLEPSRVGFGTPSPSLPEVPTRRAFRNRSPSPPSPRSRDLGVKLRRSSADIRSKVKSAVNGNEFGSLGHNTDQVCRTLRAYRKKLSNSPDTLSTETVRELERELALTAKAVGEKAMQSKGMDERVMTKLLDQYSNRLVEMLDEKIAERIARGVRKGSEAGNSSDEIGDTPTPDETASSEAEKGTRKA